MTEEISSTKWTIPNNHLSASSIDMYLKCGMKYYFRYIEKRERQKYPPQITGSAIHKGFQVYFEDKMKKVSPLTTEQLIDFTVSDWENMVQAEEMRVHAGVKDEAVFQIKNTVPPYIKGVAPAISPTGVEEEIRYKSRCGVELVGYLDLVHIEEDVPVIADYKITNKKWNYHQLANGLQFHIYALMTGIQDIRVHNLAKNKSPYAFKTYYSTGDWEEGTLDVASNIRLLKHLFCTADHNHIERIVERVAQGITAGIFIPCSPESYLCDAKWCEYWDSCKK